MKLKHKNLLKWFILALFIIFIVSGLYNKMYIQTYDIDADSITNPIKIALVTDLHSCKYGDNQQDLINEIKSQNPDLIMLGGDIFDDKISDDNTEYFLRGIVNKYPCYYVTGNHEYWGGKEKFLNKMSILKKYDIHILSGDCDTLSINNETINICGVDDPDSYIIGGENGNTQHFYQQLDDVKKSSDNENYTILLSHCPEEFKLYSQYNFDLILCGHAHGGQWRIPLLLNGLYAPNQGIFPDYAGGLYQNNKTAMIVSRGLARESTIIPRFYNRPELVIINLH